MNKKELNIHIRPFGFLDLLAFKNLVPLRKKKLAAAAPSPAQVPVPVNALAAQIHPKFQQLVISGIRDETPQAKTFRLVPSKEMQTKRPAVFRPGQYISLYVKVNGVTVSRPISLSSSPAEALDGYYEITIKKNEEGFVTKHIWENWHTGTEITSSGPEGFFYYDKLRDRKKIVGIAGGCGITPFRSMAKSIVDGNLDAELLLLYGSNTKEEILFYDEFNKMEKESKGAFKVVYVLADEEREGFEHGLLSPEIIKKHADINGSSFFLCGPQAMYDFVSKGLSKFGLRKKVMRREEFGEIKNIEKHPGYPKDAVRKSCCIKVRMGTLYKEIPALSHESVLVALERAGLCPPSRCRSGSCGFCRSLLISGKVFIPEATDGRRHADKEAGYIHTCSSFPLSDLELEVPVDACSNKN